MDCKTLSFKFCTLAALLCPAAALGGAYTGEFELAAGIPPVHWKLHQGAFDLKSGRSTPASVAVYRPGESPATDPAWKTVPLKFTDNGNGFSYTLPIILTRIRDYAVGYLDKSGMPRFQDPLLENDPIPDMILRGLDDRGEPAALLLENFGVREWTEVFDYDREGCFPLLMSRSPYGSWFQRFPIPWQDKEEAADYIHLFYLSLLHRLEPGRVQVFDRKRAAQKRMKNLFDEIQKDMRRKSSGQP